MYELLLPPDIKGLTIQHIVALKYIMHSFSGFSNIPVSRVGNFFREKNKGREKRLLRTEK